MARKAQIEVIVLLGLIFLSVVVVYLGYRGLTYVPDETPTGIGEEKNTLRAPVVNLFKTSAEKALETIENQGGYSNYGSLQGETEEQRTTISYLGGNVRFWSQCENTYIPDFDDEIIPRFEKYIRKYIVERLESILERSYREVKMDLNDLQLSVEFSKNNMLIRIFLPITLDNYTLEPDYVINIQTKFKELYDFAADFSEDQTDNRHMEWFTINSVRYSPVLATEDILFSCGEAVIQTPTTTASGLEDAVKYTLRNTFFWETNSVMTQNLYYIEKVMGNKYEHFEPNFKLPDGFRFSATTEPIIIINVDFLANKFPYIIPLCLTEYIIGYEIVYPYVVSVRDTLSGNLFNFAGLVYIDPNEDPFETGEENEGMRPGSCSEIDFIGLGDEQADYTCQEAVIRVEGHDTDHATVMYGSKVFEYDDGDDSYHATIPCDSNLNLYIYKNDTYESIVKEDLPAASVEDTYYLHRKPKVKIHYYRSVIDSVGGFSPHTYGPYSSCDVSIVYQSSLIFGTLTSDEYEFGIPTNFEGEGFDECSIDQEQLIDDVQDNCDCGPLETLFGCDAGGCAIGYVDAAFSEMGNCLMAKNIIKNVIEFDYIPGGYTYTFDFMSRDVHGFWPESRLLSDHTLSELDHDLYIYLPVREQPAFDDRYEFADAEMNALMSFVQSSCGIDFITENQISEGVYP